MFNAFYGLREDPFKLSPDPRFCYRHRNFSRAKAYMLYGLSQGEGFLMVTGRPGTGKTTLIEDLLHDPSTRGVTTTSLTSTQVEADDLLRLVSSAFGISTPGLDKASLLLRLETLLRNQMQTGRSPLLIVDDAQNLPYESMEELRMITNLQDQARPLMQVFLVGQESLRALVYEPRMEQLRQRILAACRMEPLDPSETRIYLMHRLRCAGWTGHPSISGHAVWSLHQATEGVPRQINILANRLFLRGSLEKKSTLGAEDVQVVIEELSKEHLIPPNDTRPVLETRPAGDGDKPVEDYEHLAVEAPMSQQTTEATVASRDEGQEPLRSPEIHAGAVTDASNAPAPTQAPTTPLYVTPAKPGDRDNQTGETYIARSATDFQQKSQPVLEEQQPPEHSERSASPNAEKPTPERSQGPAIEPLPTKAGTTYTQAPPHAAPVSTEPARAQEEIMASEPTGGVKDASDQAAPAEPKRVSSLPESTPEAANAAAKSTPVKPGRDRATGRAALVAGAGLLGLTLAIVYFLYPGWNDSTTKRGKTAPSGVESPDVAEQGEGPKAIAPSPVADEPVKPTTSEEPVTIPDSDKSGGEEVASTGPGSTGPQVEEAAPGSLQGPVATPAPMTETRAGPGPETTSSPVAAESSTPIATPTVLPPPARALETTSTSEAVPDKPKYAAPAPPPADRTGLEPAAAGAISKDLPEPIAPPSDSPPTSETDSDASKPEPVAPARSDTADEPPQESGLDIELVELETRLRQRGFQVERIDRGSLKLNLRKELSFGVDRTQIPPQSRKMLALLASDLASDPDLGLTVIGHTDASGPAAYNATLSLRRARAVAAFLVDNGLSARQVASDGRGETEPLTKGAVDGVPASLINRRIEILIRGKTGY